MPEDEELELLKMRKLKEMWVKLAPRKGAVEERKEEGPREILVKNLVGRGLEVLEAAEAQFPEEAKVVVNELAKLIKEGKVAGPITGEELYYVFINLGLRVKMSTKIYYEERGERKGLSDFLRERMKKS